MRRYLLAAPHSASLLLGLCLLINSIASLCRPELNATEWLIDLRHVPLRTVIAILIAAPLLAWPLSPAPSPPRGGLGRARRAAQVITIAARVASLSLAFIALVNSANYYRLLATGAIDASIPIPLSLLTAGVAFLVFLAARPASPNPRSARSLLHTLALSPAWGLAFLLAQILAFGSTDYRRPADAIVVFGARVYADGTPSLALEDRVRSAAALYHRGLAPAILMSGGPGDGPISEPQAMKHLATRLGVPAAAIITDERGENTERTVRNTGAILTPELGRAPRVIAVSHDYHLARIKITFQRAGIHAFTVPAAESRTLARKPLFITREVAALCLYYLRPFIARTE
ncbi:hypothetical protein PHYC_02741 [Phycisphaerales bacterium]|nr:hypothetical protein PHYC_02741 [Phycisphaerales bacterium]